MKRAAALLLLLTLTACATQQTETVWHKPNSSQQEFLQDRSGCLGQGFTAPNAVQLAVAFNLCMQSRGWYRVERVVR